MRVGISLVPLAPGDLGGPETYPRQLVRALARHGTLEYAVLVPAHAKEAADGLPAIEVDDAPTGKRGPSRIPLVAHSAQRIRGASRPAAALDVVHYPLTVAVPSAEAATVVTLHDLQHRDLPDFFGPVRRSFRRTAYDSAARAADAVVVPSEFVRRRALDALELDPTRVHVVPLAVDDTVFHPGSDAPEPFVLHPAEPRPHENHARLFEAFAALRTTRPRLRLLLVGEGHERLGPLPEAVESLGAVPPAALASLYRRAACLVFPSLYEGFGLPPLQAMASGCPVAASNVGGIPEVCGDAAVLFDPTDVEAMAGAMVEADSRRDALRAKGFARVLQFTWKTVAQRHDDVYRAVASEALAGMPTTS